jgi:hypothetical protein
MNAIFSAKQCGQSLASTTDMDILFRLSVKAIDDILYAPDAFSAERLMQHYDTAPDKTAFVAALIGKIVTAHYSKK